MGFSVLDSCLQLQKNVSMWVSSGILFIFSFWVPVTLSDHLPIVYDRTWKSALSFSILLLAIHRQQTVHLQWCLMFLRQPLSCLVTQPWLIWFWVSLYATEFSVGKISLVNSLLKTSRIEHKLAFMGRNPYPGLKYICPYVHLSFLLPLWKHNTHILLWKELC